MSSAANELVFLTECGTNVEASLLRGALESSGIFCHVQGENHRAVLGAMHSHHIALRLLVRRSEAEAAAAIVSEYRRAASSDAEGRERGPHVEDALDRRLARARRKALFPAFGMAHHHMGAHGRGLVFGAAQAYGVYAALSGRVREGAVLFVAALLFDLFFVGAVAIAARARPRRG